MPFQTILQSLDNFLLFYTKLSGRVLFPPVFTFFKVKKFLALHERFNIYPTTNKSFKSKNKTQNMKGKASFSFALFKQFCYNHRRNWAIKLGGGQKNSAPFDINLVLLEVSISDPFLSFFPQFCSLFSPCCSLLGVPSAPPGPFLHCAYGCFPSSWGTNQESISYIRMEKHSPSMTKSDLLYSNVSATSLSLVLPKGRENLSKTLPVIGLFCFSWSLNDSTQPANKSSISRKWRL